VSETVRSLLSEKLSAIVAYKYFGQGLSGVELHTQSGRVLNIRSCEVQASPFEAYSLEIQDGPCEADVNGNERFDFDFTIVTVDLLRRDEWVAQDAPSHEVVGSNPGAIEAGRVGGAPAGTSAISVLCGYAFHSDSVFGGRRRSLLVYTVDYPGLVDLTMDDEQISEFCSRTTIERVD
jgi:hypothetical protein